MANGTDSVRITPLPMGEATLRAGVSQVTGVRSASPLRQAIRRLWRRGTSMAGLLVVSALVLVAIFADVLAPRSPIASDQTHTFERPSWTFPLGTDQLGRDMLSRLIHGSRVSLAVGVSSVLLA